MAQSLTGYYIGIAIECVIIVIAGVLLALMLTGLLFKWMAAAAERREERRARKEAERAEKEAARLAAEEEERLAREEAERIAAEEAAMAELEEPVEEVVEEPAEPEVVEQVETVIVKKKIVKVVEEVEEVEPEPQPAPAPLSEPEPEVVEEVTEEEDGDKGIVFAESKTITELYEELTNEQKSFFDELREEALTKPDAELSMSRNFVTVKIGKRNLIKLLIKRGVTVAEFMLENEALKQLRLSNRNKKGKNAIRVKPTVVQVLDLPSLKVAVDMINLAYEELMLAE